jgi:hypothetical protein
MNQQSVNQSGNLYLTQFQNIRDNAKVELRKLGLNHIAAVQDTVLTCLAAILEERSIVKAYCHEILERLRCNDSDKLLSTTLHNCVLSIDKVQVLVTFDITDKVKSISFLNHVNIKDSVDLKLYSTLCENMAKVIDLETPSDLALRYDQITTRRHKILTDMQESRQKVKTTVKARICTVYDLVPGLSFYTLNYSEDMSMLFWDRYTIVNETAKSFYIEQHCIVESLIRGEVEPERYITMHRPSKNQVPIFLSERHACLDEMERPTPKGFKPKDDTKYQLAYDIIE